MMVSPCRNPWQVGSGLSLCIGQPIRETGFRTPPPGTFLYGSWRPGTARSDRQAGQPDKRGAAGPLPGEGAGQLRRTCSEVAGGRSDGGSDRSSVGCGRYDTGFTGRGEPPGEAYGHSPRKPDGFAIGPVKRAGGVRGNRQTTPAVGVAGSIVRGTEDITSSGVVGGRWDVPGGPVAGCLTNAAGSLGSRCAKSLAQMRRSSVAYRRL
jgi:hypothetical protein